VRFEIGWKQDVAEGEHVAFVLSALYFVLCFFFRFALFPLRARNQSELSTKFKVQSSKKQILKGSIK